MPILSLRDRDIYYRKFTIKKFGKKNSGKSPPPPDARPWGVPPLLAALSGHFSGLFGLVIIVYSYRVLIYLVAVLKGPILPPNLLTRLYCLTCAALTLFPALYPTFVGLILALSLPYLCLVCYLLPLPLYLSCGPYFWPLWALLVGPSYLCLVGLILWPYSRLFVPCNTCVSLATFVGLVGLVLPCLVGVLLALLSALVYLPYWCLVLPS